MSNDTTQHTPADVRERVAREIREAAWADPTGLRKRQNAEALADRILALLRTPRGEGAAAHRDGAQGDWFTAEMIEAVRFASGLFAAGEWGPVLAQAADRMEAFRTAALRSEAQGEVWREIDDLLARLERFEYDAAGESEEYCRVVAMRERIAAARRSEGGGK